MLDKDLNHMDVKKILTPKSLALHLYNIWKIVWIVK